MLWEKRLSMLHTGGNRTVVVTSFYVMGWLPLTGHGVEKSRSWELPYASCSLEITVLLVALKSSNAYLVIHPA